MCPEATGVFSFYVSWVLGHGEWSLMKGFQTHSFLTSWEGKFLTLQGLYQNSHGSIPHGGTKITVHVHYNESMGYNEAEIEG